jgi:hypothetical protein
MGKARQGIENGWQREFDEPIVAPDGAVLKIGAKYADGDDRCRTLHDGVTIWSQVPTRSLAILALHWRLDHVNRSDTDYRGLERLGVRNRIANEGLATP